MKDEGLIYGINPLLEALRSGGRRFNKVYLLKGRRDKDMDEIVLLAKRLGATIYYEPREILDRIAPHKRHQGAVGMVSPKEYATIEDILDAARSRDEVPFILIIDGIDDPRNLGAIIRSAEGAGVHGIV
ncbi:MAG TPA: RNA methyltransferase substrate-binding domain-containing protein, partial [Nitrospiria bacterium]|nr:RNA methyltransferase substrate-binding domain-containing protein [Nitrospiria bacterium]